MDARLESFVKMADFVGREKEDARIEFEHSKEDRDNAVATHVLAVTSLEKDVGFIELEKYRISTYREDPQTSRLSSSCVSIQGLTE